MDGSLLDGSGLIESTGSGAIEGLEVTWASRSEAEQSGRTSPEELIAAAHAACFCMALSGGLAKAGNTAAGAQRHRNVDVRAGHGHHADEARRDGTVEGLDEAAFLAAAEGAIAELPGLGRAQGNVEILLDARLAS